MQQPFEEHFFFFFRRLSVAKLCKLSIFEEAPKCTEVCMLCWHTVSLTAKNRK